MMQKRFHSVDTCNNTIIYKSFLQSIKKEIERRLDCIQRIAYEPQLIWDDDSRYILKPDTTLPPFYYRLKAVDDIKILGKNIF